MGISLVKNPKILVEETVRSTAVGTSRISQEVNEGDFVLNREKHPIFDTTNCVQGTYVM